ncbi:hypothetical protein BUALT_Bualt02G0033200 [Buddleja alternifolia]|uniref:Glycosyltransferase 2-like domain-containing protein n=1 Tax=Buddleja alternifolia TaxID=168488 RepID=A0AAV6Y3I8_9LAMI|nr:hypothetical protein BUALT_Bualt02G0033200 [Buddleja alternifolia]
MIEKECIKWVSEGINIRYQIRETRRGYKAGALKEGLERDMLKNVSTSPSLMPIFSPSPTFSNKPSRFSYTTRKLRLYRPVGVNADECFLTRMQEMSLDYQFAIEQEGGSSIHSFFSFNGSGGIWRMAAINEAGGWKDRTTVEDMDLAVRDGLKGWKFVYLGNLHTRILNFFRSFHLAVPWVLFENVMSFHRTKALIIGLLEAKRANEWVVTEKLGDALKHKSNGESNAPKEPARLQLLRDRILLQELGIAVFLFACGCYGVFYGNDRYFIYLFPQAIFFTITGFGYFGTIVPALDTI